MFKVKDLSSGNSQAILEAERAAFLLGMKASAKCKWSDAKACPEYSEAR
jgi:hypothetical protein